MNVKELREVVANLPDDMEVILQKDAEGNNFSPLEGADPNSIYVSESTWSGDVYSTDWSAWDAGMDKEDWEEFKKNPRALVLYPVN